MTSRSRLTTSAQREALVGVKRACRAGLDSVALRTELVWRMASVVPVDAYSFATVDPEMGLLTHAVVDGLSARLLQVYLEHVYPCQTAVLALEKVQEGESVVRMADLSRELREVLLDDSLEHEANLLPAIGGMLWGSWCLLRERGARSFDDSEIGFLRHAAPHIAQGLRAAALLEAAQEENATAAGAGAVAPGVLVLDGRGRTISRTASAAEQLLDLADVGLRTEEMPYAIASAILQLRAALARGDAEVDAPMATELRVRGRSGRRYALHASLAQPDACGVSWTIIVIEPLVKRAVAPALTPLYGLTPREREVLAMTARGESTKRMAARLGVSPYTVQDHLDNACEKVGVRGRRALVAKLFLEASLPRLKE